jgi:hypothetical protein
MVSEAWRDVGPEERAVYEEMSRLDKARYDIEKAMYKGAWSVPIGSKRPKDALAPKRPMSAFLAFSNKRRAMAKVQMPGASNADVSKALSKMWKEAPEDLRKQYVDEEAELRQQYKVSIAEWRKKDDESLKMRQDDAMKMVAESTRDTSQHTVSYNMSPPYIGHAAAHHRQTALSSGEAYTRGFNFSHWEGHLLRELEPSPIGMFAVVSTLGVVLLDPSPTDAFGGISEVGGFANMPYLQGDGEGLGGNNEHGTGIGTLALERPEAALDPDHSSTFLQASSFVSLQASLDGTSEIRSGKTCILLALKFKHYIYIYI